MRQCGSSLQAASIRSRGSDTGTFLPSDVIVTVTAFPNRSTLSRSADSSQGLDERERETDRVDERREAHFSESAG
jgi:hypothetical protein